MLSGSQIESFNRDGFLNGGRVLDADGVEELRDELDRIIREAKSPSSPGGPGSEKRAERKPFSVRNAGGESDSIVRVVNTWQGSAAFEQLIYNPRIVMAISQLCPSPDLIMYHDQLVYKPPHHNSIVGWHQDAPYWTIVEPTTPVSAWVALDDVDDDNGAMWMVPGSHRWGNAMNELAAQAGGFYNPAACGFITPKGDEIHKDQTKLRKLAAGGVDIIIRGCGTAQAAVPTARGGAIAIHYVTGESRFNARGEHDVKPLITLRVDDEPMRNAGPAFPLVCRGGVPVAAAKERV